LSENNGEVSKRALIKHEINQYAVNDMRIGRRNQEPTDAKKKILTTARDKIAQMSTPGDTARGGRETNKITNLDDLLNIDFLAMQEGKTDDQGEHPFDLSFVHS
jgi:hypothetical protein